MGTSTLRVVQPIQATPEVVFAAATNIRSWPDVIPAIEKVEVLTDGPVAIGTRFRETRKMFGREATEEMEFVELEAPSRYVLLAESHGCRYRTEHLIEPTADGSTLTMVFHATPLTFFSKVMAFLMKPMMKKMTEMCAKDLAALKDHIES